MSEVEKIDENLSLALRIFKENKIPYWICHGTLLGIIRDKKLMDWDHDVDIAIWEKTISKAKLTEIMISNNFTVKPQFFVGDGLTCFHRNGGKQVDIHYYKTTFNKIENKEMAVFFPNYIPKNIFLKFVDAISMANIYEGNFKYLIKILIIFQPIFKFIKAILVKKNMFYNAIGYCEPLEFLNEFKEIIFSGTKLTIPHKPEEYLQYIYGKNWKVPDKNYHYANEHVNDPTTLTRS